MGAFGFRPMRLSTMPMAPVFCRAQPDALVTGPAVNTGKEWHATSHATTASDIDT